MFNIPVARLTAQIRCLQETMEQFPRNVKAKVNMHRLSDICTSGLTVSMYDNKATTDHYHSMQQS